MNNLLRSQYLLRLLQNEIHNCTIRRAVHSSVCLRDTKSKEHDGNSKPDVDKTTSPDTSSSSSASAGTTGPNLLFGALAGMRAVKDRELSGEKKVGQIPVMRKKKVEVNKSEVKEFKTAEALKTAMEQATKKVSESFPDTEKTESDLVKQLRRYDEAKAAGERGDTSAISSLLTGMKVEEDKEAASKKETNWGQQTKPEWRSTRSEASQRTQPDEGRGMMWGQESMPDRRQQKSQMEGFLSRSNKRLDIFTLPGEEKQEVAKIVEPATKTIWDIQQENELREVVKGQHRHAFDEMLEWSNEGKIWKYPIDNEQGFEEEQTIGFHEHVLLDDLIEDFPKTGPIREFMELVIVGLSKNPYFTVKQKHEHIDWFRQYFTSKEDVLRESKAITEDFSFASTG